MEDFLGILENSSVSHRGVNTSDIRDDCNDIPKHR